VSYDKNISPCGWYVASYLLRFVECNAPDNNNLEKQFLIWENTIIIKANSLDEAYDKTVAIAEMYARPYKGGEDTVDVQWLFEGITELLPIYEELQDGAEIMWGERHRKLKNIQKLIRKKEEFYQ
jgi:hypothetical protein